MRKVEKSIEIISALTHTTGTMVTSYHSCSIWENKANVMLDWYKCLKVNDGLYKEVFDNFLDVFTYYEDLLIEEANKYPDAKNCIDYYFNKKREVE